MKDLFEQLRERMDTTGIGFPDVPGVAIPYLKKFFTEDFARVYLAMDDKFQLAEEVAKRLDRDPEELRSVLEEMAQKGLVFTTTNTDPTLYAPWPWLTGWGDWTAYWEDAEAAKLEEEFKMRAPMSGEGFRMFRRNIFRTVPIYETIPDRNTVAPYDDVRQVLANAGTISVADCYCERHRQLRGQSTNSPLERCFLFGTYAEYLIDKGFGRKVSVDEAMEILAKCKDVGMTQNITDLRNPVFLCNCTEYCINPLRINPPGPFKEYERTNNYLAEVDTDLCVGCGECVNRCWVKAIEVGSDSVAAVQKGACIGCGICVVKCPVDAISLKEVPKSEHYTPAAKRSSITIKSNEEYMAEIEQYRDVVKPRKES